MAGLVPAIHVFLKVEKQDVDARDVSAFTRVFDALCAGMTSETIYALAFGVRPAAPHSALILASRMMRP
jgi:hypothetical protein